MSQVLIPKVNLGQGHIFSPLPTPAQVNAEIPGPRALACLSKLCALCHHFSIALELLSSPSQAFDFRLCNAHHNNIQEDFIIIGNTLCRQWRLGRMGPCPANLCLQLSHPHPALLPAYNQPKGWHCPPPRVTVPSSWKKTSINIDFINPRVIITVH